jgi:endoglucanase
MKSLIKKLVETPGPSGYETQIRTLIRAEVEPFVDDIYTDNLGNLIARVGRRNDLSNGLKIMLAAHMDEIGVIATHVDKHGFVRFTSIGGLRPHTCLGGHVRFLKSDRPQSGAVGVIGAERLSDTSKMYTFDQMYIDLGISDVGDFPVRVGNVGVFERPFIDMGKRLVSKALDDRVGVAILIEGLRELHRVQSRADTQIPHELFFVFSVQEEVGSRGATTAAYGIDPDLGLAVDVTGSGDTPNGLKMETGLSMGPAIKVRDQSMLADPRVVNWIVETAQRANIPYQMEVLERGYTDARSIQLARAGVPAGCISIPCRYTHSPSEMVDYDDVKNTVRLLVELLQGPIEF